jgi:hypothetical protein
VNAVIRGVVACALLVGAAPMAGADCEREPACSEFWHSDVVFIGRCIDERGDGRHALLVVDEVFRGDPGLQALVGAPREIREGETYLVLANRAHRDPGPGRFGVGECSGTTAVHSRVRSDVEYVRFAACATEGDGTLAGWIDVALPALSSGGVKVDDIRPARRCAVTLVSAERALETRTDDKGGFSFTVPAGFYYLIVPSFDGYVASPRLIEMGPGACRRARVTLRAAP